MSVTKEEYHRRKENGLCVMCEGKAREGRTTCQSCADKIRDYKRMRAADPYISKKDGQKRKELYERRKAEHLCAHCGTPLPEGNKWIYCERCHYIQMKAVYKYQRSISAKQEK